VATVFAANTIENFVKEALWQLLLDLLVDPQWTLYPRSGHMSTIGNGWGSLD